MQHRRRIEYLLFLAASLFTIALLINNRITTPASADLPRLHGVASQVNLMGYKVCLGVGSCLSTSTSMDIEDAVSPVTVDLQPKPPAHVINLSPGGPGRPDDDSAITTSNAALLGPIVVASAGNEGPGEGTVGSPAVDHHVIAIGANNKTYISAVLAPDSGLQRDILEDYVAADVSYVDAPFQVGQATVIDFDGNTDSSGYLHVGVCGSTR